ncbi:hypothetical protein DIPPA_33695 [Diplonema papillatum]|nr:hypothetical protein DIPPA_33695 [Diplonema papillatum]
MWRWETGASATCASSACGGRRRGPRPSRLRVAPNRASRSRHRALSGPRSSPSCRRAPPPLTLLRGGRSRVRRPLSSARQPWLPLATVSCSSARRTGRRRPLLPLGTGACLRLRPGPGHCRCPGTRGFPAGLGGADQVVPAASCGEGDPVGPAAPHREAAPVAAGAARDAADQAGSPDAIEGADQVEPAGAPAGRAGDRAADAQTAERKLRRERRRFRHAADLTASGSSVVEPFPDSDESDSDGESESGSSGDVGGRGGGDDRDGGDRSGPGSGNGGPGGDLSLAGQPASDAPDASAEPGQPEAPSEAGLENGSATDRSGLAVAPAEVSPSEGGAGTGLPRRACPERPVPGGRARHSGGRLGPRRQAPCVALAGRHASGQAPQAAPQRRRPPRRVGDAPFWPSMGHSVGSVVPDRQCLGGGAPPVPQSSRSGAGRAVRDGDPRRWAGRQRSHPGGGSLLAGPAPTRQPSLSELAECCVRNTGDPC